MTARSDGFGEILELLYDAAIDPTVWPTALEAIRNGLGAEMFQVHVARAATGKIDMIGTNFPSAILQGYADGWWKKDPWVIAGLAQRRGFAFRGTDVCPDSVFVKSEIYNELVRPAHDIRHIVGGLLDVDADRMSVGFLRPSAVSNFTPSECRLLQRLMPHLQRAMQVRERLDLAEQKGAAAQSALDLLRFGVVVVDQACRPLAMNRAAEAIVARGDGLVGGSALRPLAAYSSSETARLHALVASAATPVGSRGPGGALWLRRTTERPAYSVIVAPMARRQRSLLPSHSSAAMLIVRDPEAERVPRTRILRDLYSLTGAEAELAERLAAGDRLEDVAERRGVRLTTLRTQVRGILAKTGLDRQAALVSLLAGLAF